MAEAMPLERLAEVLWTARARARETGDPRPLATKPAYTRERYLRFAEEVATLLGAAAKTTDEAAVERAIMSSAEGGITARGAARAAWRLLAPPLRVLEAQLDQALAERDEARALAGVRGDLVDELRTKLGRAQRAGREAEAERDAALAELAMLKDHAGPAPGEAGERAAGRPCACSGGES